MGRQRFLIRFYEICEICGFKTDGFVKDIFSRNDVKNAKKIYVNIKDLTLRLCLPCETFVAVVSLGARC